jgi:hypothetical protein
MRKLGSIAFNPNKKKRNKNVTNSSLGRWGDLLASSDISSPVSVLVGSTANHESASQQ